MLRREHADAARAGQSENGWCLKQKPAQRATNDSPSGTIVRFFLYRVSRAFRGLFGEQHRVQYGTALTPGGRWLRPPRQIGITSNRCHAGSLRGVAVRGYWLTVVITCIRGNTVIAPPRARGRRPRRAVGRFAGFLGSSIAYSTGLPSRRAGGGFGHPVRLVLSRIGVMPRVYVVRPLIYQNCCALGAEHAVCLLSTVHAMPRFSKRGCFLVDKYQKRSTATSICWRNSYLCLTI